MKKKTCAICHSTIQDYQHICIQCGAKIKRTVFFRFSQYHPIKQILLLNILLLFYLYIRNYRFPFHFISVYVLFSTFAIIVFSLFKSYVSSKYKYKTPIYYFLMLFFYTCFIIISFDLTPKILHEGKVYKLDQMPLNNFEFGSNPANQYHIFVKNNVNRNVSPISYILDDDYIFEFVNGDFADYVFVMYNHEQNKNYGWRNYWNYVQIINHHEMDSETLSRIIENENHLGVANKVHYNLKIHKVPIDKILIFLRSDLYQDYINDLMTSEELHLYFTNLIYPDNFLFDMKFDASGFIYFETFDGKKLFDRIPQQIQLSEEILLLYNYID